ncbi:hypothetical protein CHUAL_013110 [Chamberlinius hualienensis]
MVQYQYQSSTPSNEMDSYEYGSTMDDNVSVEWNCLLPYITEEGLHCNVTFDKVLCWPYTLAGTTAVISCPYELRGILYDTSKNARKHCYADGSWANYSDYSDCKPLEDLETNSGEEELTRLIYLIGYSASLVAVIIALVIFLNFKDLRCLRNTFHQNLLATYLLNALFWIITTSLHIDPEYNHTAPCVLLAIVYYCQGTNFFWMFVEGFYLYMLVVRTFTVDKIPFGVYIFIGWGVPAIVVAVWAIVKAVLAQPVSSSITVGLSCPWLEKDSYEWIFSGPILLVLVVNMIFLGKIMWVLITKLRAATTAESQQYRKAAKALLVLIPLLGITYVVLLVAPNNGMMAIMLNYIRAVLISTQGFTVAVLYCFLNGEVKNTLQHHFDAWRSSRNLSGDQKFSCRYRDGSPRSRTESIRLCSAVNNDCRCDMSNNANRESCVSCLTTHSFVGNGHSTLAVANKMGNNHVENQLLVVAQTTGNDVEGTHSHLARSGTSSTVNSIKENSV